MANPEHLQILKQGVRAWNAWREQHRDITPDLTEADLRGDNFSGANFTDVILTSARLERATLFNADFTNATLVMADLSRVDLSGNIPRNWRSDTTADFTHANLTKATLTDANFVEATLIDANLTQARLENTNLSEADLTRADLSKGILLGTVFGATNLTAVRGLESCAHYGPSTIDHRTLAKSGPLPLAFLRGCGLPDALIDYLPSLLNQPFQFYSCFISYASRDHAFAERLYADLQNKGVRCWFAPEDMKIGDEFRSRIDASIHVHDRLLLILSQHSIKSRWVQKEVETAFEKEAKENRLVLFPIRLDETVMHIDMGWAADIRRQRHIGDFTQWKEHDPYQRAFARLLRDLTATTQKPDASA
jgi:uncharacterized protein YjbI with pentapeptide repeats